MKNHRMNLDMPETPENPVSHLESLGFHVTSEAKAVLAAAARRGGRRPIRVAIVGLTDLGVSERCSLWDVAGLAANAKFTTVDPSAILPLAERFLGAPSKGCGLVRDAIGVYLLSEPVVFGEDEFLFKLRDNGRPLVEVIPLRAGPTFTSVAAQNRFVTLAPPR